jgi:Xaa-Pro aminopeptidase
MRRGLISWSLEEMPIAALDQRVARLQAAMRAENMGAVLVYTSFAQPSAVHWLTNFTPYWSEALAVVLPQGAPVLLASLTKRVHMWIREVSHLGDVLMAARLGVEAVKFLDGKIGSGERVGIVAMDSLPWAVAEPLFSANAEGRLVDASAMFAALRQPGDRQEHALSDRAAQMACDAFEAAPSRPTKVSEVAAAIEASARLAGAEEVLLRFAPDLGRGAVLQRMEGDATLGETYAVEVSVAYKGVWIRLARSLSRGPEPSSWALARRWFEKAAKNMGAVSAGELPDGEPGKLQLWVLEASLGVHPLSVVAAKDVPPTFTLPQGSHAVFSVQLELDDGYWCAAAPVVI